MKPRILLVEDDANLVELVSYNLDKEGFDVATTHDGEEALVLAEESRPDLIILDWMIANLSGIEVCRRLRPRAPAHRQPADRHADRARRGGRPHPRPGDGRGRLYYQAVLTPRTGRPGPRRAAPAAARRCRAVRWTMPASSWTPRRTG